MQTATLDPAADPQERAKGIGGSDVPVILGLSNYKTALDLYLEKRGLWQDEQGSEAAAWGRIMEPVLCREYVHRYDERVLRPGGEVFCRDAKANPIYPVVSYLYAGPHARLVDPITHPVHPWARGNPDGIRLTERQDPCGITEFKTASEYFSGQWGAQDTDEVPLAYLVQVQWYLMLTELERADMVVLIGGNRLRRYIIQRDDELIDMLLERCAAFWERVQLGNPPPADTGDRAELGRESLRRLYGKADPEKKIDCTPHFANLVRTRALLDAELKNIERQKLEVENEVISILADATRCDVAEKVYVSFSEVKGQTRWKDVAADLALRAGIDSKALAALAEQHSGEARRQLRFQGAAKLLEG